jgi:hypothetical protein
LKPVLSLCQEEAYELITDIYGRSIIDEAFNLCTGIFFGVFLFSVRFCANYEKIGGFELF